MTEVHDRNFAAQVNAINCGFARMNGIDYDFIGNLDSDISFEPAYLKSFWNDLTLDERFGISRRGYLRDKCVLSLAK